MSVELNFPLIDINMLFLAENSLNIDYQSSSKSKMFATNTKNFESEKTRQFRPKSSTVITC